MAFCVGEKELPHTKHVGGNVTEISESMCFDTVKYYNLGTFTSDGDTKS